MKKNWVIGIIVAIIAVVGVCLGMSANGGKSGDSLASIVESLGDEGLAGLKSTESQYVYALVDEDSEITKKMYMLFDIKGDKIVGASYIIEFEDEETAKLAKAEAEADGEDCEIEGRYIRSVAKEEELEEMTVESLDLLFGDRQ